MNKLFKYASVGLILSVAANVAMARHDGGDITGNCAVTITNLTPGQTFTPIMVASTVEGQHVFSLGSVASSDLEAVAESGDTGPLEATLINNGVALATASSGALLDPGQSVTVNIPASGKFRYLSIASMLVPTNDGFIAVNNIALPKVIGKRVTAFSRVYDAGTETNDELCGNIPGPFCGGEPFNAASGEGFVHVHNGIHGIGDLSPAQFDWKNPAAKIMITCSQ